MVDLTQLEEMHCPTCQRPFILVPVAETPSRYRFEGCRCTKQDFFLPDAVGAVGIAGGPGFWSSDAEIREANEIAEKVRNLDPVRRWT